MTFSNLISGTVPHRNKYSSRQGRPVLKVIQHHWGGTTGGEERLTNPNQKASCTYLVYNDGTIKGQVPEEFRPWTSGSFEADGDAITIEVQNSSGQVNGNNNDPESWKISAAAERSIEKLVADVAERYGWGAITAKNYRGHREFSATACPGGYIWNRMSLFRRAMNALLGADSTPDAPPTKNKTVWQLADEVLAGLHGSGDARKKSLGENYAAVQAEVNRRLGAKSETKPAKKSVSQLADEVIAGAHGTGDARKKSLGSRYSEVQAEVNRRLAGKSDAGGKNISQLADEVLLGKHGSGDARKKSLGKYYSEVQAEVNRRLR